ncbi:MAG: exosortase system-associated protein, TIGR04073 family [Candidatus Omnitrophica bacterium]|nr:exosortase system-associated protein, TIGR04073 family [Candidatus Omnitrophota bacterium]
MKKIISIVLVTLFILNIAQVGYCGPMRKLGRGVSNLLTFPYEIPHRIMETNKRAGPYEAATYGLLEGLCMMVGRAGAGFYEVVSFPIPVPPGYEPLINDPEMFWK